VFKAIATGQIKHQVLVFGLVFVVAGLAFKLGVVPFHMWIPDVYQGAPTAVTLMIGGAPKLAAFAITSGCWSKACLPLAIDWQQMLAAGHRLAAGGQPGGHCADQPQAHAGLLHHLADGLRAAGPDVGCHQRQCGCCRPPNAYSSAMFYVVTYVLTTLATFGVILLLARKGFESEEIADLAGLNQRSPLYAGVMAVCLFSLAGIPPWWASMPSCRCCRPDGVGPGAVHRAGGVRRDDVADRRLLLPARGQGHVF
jgi:NADH-quinone oxidoreductase subunit N